MSFRVNWDAVGITASIACALHCAALPLLPTGFLILGMDIAENIVFEWIMIAIACAVGLYALWHGYKKHHRNVQPVIIFGIGIMLLIFKQIWHHYQFLFLPFAVLLIVVAHFINHRLSRIHHHREDGSCHHSKAA